VNYPKKQHFFTIIRVKTWFCPVLSL